MKDSPYAIARVWPGLWIGNVAAALQPPVPVTALLNVAAERDLDAPRCLYHKIPIVDGLPIPQEQLREAVCWIHRHLPRHRILLFCNAGVRRAPSVAVGYLCCFAGMSFGQAVEHVARQKPHITLVPELICTVDAVRKQLAKAGSTEPR